MSSAGVPQRRNMLPVGGNLWGYMLASASISPRAGGLEYRQLDLALGVAVVGRVKEYALLPIPRHNR